MGHMTRVWFGSEAVVLWVRANMFVQSSAITILLMVQEAHKVTVFNSLDFVCLLM